MRKRFPEVSIQIEFLTVAANKHTEKKLCNIYIYGLPLIWFQQASSNGTIKVLNKL